MRRSGSGTSFRRTLALVAFAAAVLTSACSGSSANPADPTASGATPAPTPRTRTTEAVFLQSSDGVIEFEVPAGAVFEGTELAIEIVDPDEVPGIEAATPIGSAYRLLPSDVRFAEPLIVTYRLPIAEGDSAGAIPLIFTVTASDGSVRRLAEQRTEVFPDELVQLSYIDGFGAIVLLDGGVTFTLDPARTDGLEAGDTFEATLTTTTSPATIEPWPDYGIELRWLSSGSVSDQSTSSESLAALALDGPQSEWQVANEFTCDVVGDGDYAAEIGIDISTAFDETPSRQFVLVGGEATCGEVGR